MGGNLTDFSFDDSKRFHENCTAFLESIKEIDPEMAAIFGAHWDKLLPVVHQGDRDTKARTAFNEDIATALDELLRQDAEAEGN